MSCFPRTCCLDDPDDGTPYHQAYFGVRALRFYMTFLNANQPQPTPSKPNSFYTFAAAYWNDDMDTSLWTSFDTTRVSPNAKGFSGVETDGQYLYLVPSTPGSLVTRYDTTQPAGFTTPGSAWATYDPTDVDESATSFSGGCFDGTNVYFAPSANGTVIQYDAESSFTLPSAWSAFDTTSLEPPAQKFAGAVFDPYTGWVVFVPGANGVAAAYNTYSGPFASGSSWVTYDLTTKDPSLTQFHGGVAVANAVSDFIYFAPHGVAPSYPGVAAQWNPQGAFDDPTAWATFDLALVDPNIAGVAVYGGAVYDGKQYVYFVPAATGTADGGDVLRFDTTAAGGFTDVASWAFYAIGTPTFTTGGWDGRFLYLSGANPNITSFDTTGAFSSFESSFMSWTSFSAATVDKNAVAFQGSIFDARYLYFVPETFSTIVRFDAHFPPGNIPQQASFY